MSLNPTFTTVTVTDRIFFSTYGISSNDVLFNTLGLARDSTNFITSLPLDEFYVSKQIQSGTSLGAPILNIGQIAFSDDLDVDNVPRIQTKAFLEKYFEVVNSERIINLATLDVLDVTTANITDLNIDNSLGFGTGGVIGFGPITTTGDITTTGGDLYGSNLHLSTNMFMTGAPNTNRSITGCCFYNFLPSTLTGNGARLYFSTSTAATLENNINSGSVTLATKDSGGTLTTILSGASDAINSYRPFYLLGTASTDRQIYSCYFNLTNTNGLTEYQSSRFYHITSTFFLQNLKASGSINLVVYGADGVTPITPITMNSNQVTISIPLVAQSTLTVTGATQINNTLGVTGTATMAAINGTNISASGTLTSTGNFSVTTGTASLKNTTVTGTLGVTSTSTLAGTTCTTLTASGATQINNTLGVTGTATMNAINGGNISASGTLGVTGTSTLAATTCTTLTASGTTTAALINASSLAVSGGSSFSTISSTGLASLSSLSVANNTATLTLGVTGTATMAAINGTNISASGTLSVTGNTTASTMTLSGQLTTGANIISQTTNLFPDTTANSFKRSNFRTQAAVEATGASSSTIDIIDANTTGRKFSIFPNAISQLLNPMVVINDRVLVGSSSSIDVNATTITNWGTVASGLRIVNTSATAASSILRAGFGNLTISTDTSTSPNTGSAVLTCGNSYLNITEANPATSSIATLTSATILLTASSNSITISSNASQPIAVNNFIKMIGGSPAARKINNISVVGFFDNNSPVPSGTADIYLDSSVSGQMIYNTYVNNNYHAFWTTDGSAVNAARFTIASGNVSSLVPFHIRSTTTTTRLEIIPNTSGLQTLLANGTSLATSLCVQVKNSGGTTFTPVTYSSTVETHTLPVDNSAAVPTASTHTGYVTLNTYGPISNASNPAAVYNYGSIVLAPGTWQIILNFAIQNTDSSNLTLTELIMGLSDSSTTFSLTTPALISGRFKSFNTFIPIGDDTYRQSITTVSVTSGTLTVYILGLYNYSAASNISVTVRSNLTKLW